MPKKPIADDLYEQLLKAELERVQRERQQQQPTPDAQMSSSAPVVITHELIDSGQSSAGGWSKKQAAILGVRWPLRQGWKLRVIGKTISAADAERFVAMRKARKEPEGVPPPPKPQKGSTYMGRSPCKVYFDSTTNPPTRIELAEEDWIWPC